MARRRPTPTSPPRAARRSRAAPSSSARAPGPRAAERLLRAGHIDRGIEQVRTVLARVGMALPATPGRALASVLVRRALVRLRGLRLTERRACDVAADELTRVDICWSLASLGLIDTIRGADFGARQLLLALQVG